MIHNTPNNNWKKDVLGMSICISFYIILSYLRLNSMTLFYDGLFLEVQNGSLWHYMNSLWASNYLMKWIYLASSAAIIWSKVKTITKIIILTNLTLLSAFFFWGVHLAYLFPATTQERSLIKIYFVDILQGQLPIMTVMLIVLATILIIEIKNRDVKGMSVSTNWEENRKSDGIEADNITSFWLNL